MKETHLEERREQTKAQFDALQKQKSDLEKELTNVQTQIDDTEAELARLQGEYRVLTELIESSPAPEPKLKNIKTKKDTPADVLDVTDVPGANEEPKNE